MGWGGGVRRGSTSRSLERILMLPTASRPGPWVPLGGTPSTLSQYRAAPPTSHPSSGPQSVQASAGLDQPISGPGTSGGRDPQRVSDLLWILASCGVGRVAEATGWPWCAFGQWGGLGSRCQSGVGATLGCPAPASPQLGCLLLGAGRGPHGPTASVTPHPHAATSVP